MIGKAMNDPIANLSAMSRSGVQFTKDQKEMIKVLWEAGKTAEAHAIILKELESQFGGTAKAIRETFGGAVEAAKNTLGDTKEELGFVITKNQFMIDLVKMAETRFESWGESIKANREYLQSLTKSGILYMMDGFTLSIKTMKFMHLGWLGFKKVAQEAIRGVIMLLEMLFEGLRMVLKPLDMIFDALVKLGKIGSNPFDEMEDAIWTMGKAAADVSKDIDADIKTTKKVYDGVIGKVEDWQEAIEDIPVAQVKTSRAVIRSTRDVTRTVVAAEEEKKKKTKETTKAMTDYYSDFSYSSHGVFKNVLVDGMEGDLDDFSDYFGSFTSDLKNKFADMLSDWASNWGQSGIMSYLNGGSGPVGGGIGGGGGISGVGQSAVTQGLKSKALSYLKGTDAYKSAAGYLGLGGGLQTTGIATTGSLTTQGGATYGAVSGAGGGASTAAAVSPALGLAAVAAPVVYGYFAQASAKKAREARYYMNLVGDKLKAVYATGIYGGPKSGSWANMYYASDLQFQPGGPMAQLGNRIVAQYPGGDLAQSAQVLRNWFSPAMKGLRRDLISDSGMSDIVSYTGPNEAAFNKDWIAGLIPAHEFYAARKTYGEDPDWITLKQQSHSDTRKHGGPVYPGKLYRTHFAEGEIFSPGQPGRIIPAGEAGGGEMTIRVMFDDDRLRDLIKFEADGVRIEDLRRSPGLSRMYQ